MKLSRILSVVVIYIAVGLAGIVTVADAQTYFEDNFDNPNESEKKWFPLHGQWEFNDDEYHQLLNSTNCMSVVSDEFWNDDWNEYTYELKGSKIGGAEGFLIMFRCKGRMTDRDVGLGDHPDRMEKEKTTLEYWWNLGGWANVRSQVESWGGKGGANSNHTINTDEWYEIKIVNTPADYTLYLNGEEVASVSDSTQEGKGRIGLATWSTTARFDDVIVYGPDGPSKQAVESKGKVTTTWASIKSGLK